MNTRLLRSLAIAFAAGLVAAMPLVLLLVTDPPWLGHGPAGFIVVPAVALCPPWWLSWSLAGGPEGTSHVLHVGVVVAALNAFLYAPLGALHLFAAKFGTATRRTLVAAGVVLLLGCGHWFFMQEPAIIGALLE